MLQVDIFGPPAASVVVDVTVPSIAPGKNGRRLSGILSSNENAPRTLYQLSNTELATADQRYPKWATLCRLRSLGLPVLNGVLATPGDTPEVIDAAVRALAGQTRQQRLLLRSDGGIEKHQYYRGGNTFPTGELAPRIRELLAHGRAVILLEPTNRFTNQLSVQIRMDRTRTGRAGQFTIEALGPGYDNSDLARGGIRPQIVVTMADVDWSSYGDVWWSDLHLTRDQSIEAENLRRQSRLRSLARYVLADVGELSTELVTR